MAYIVHALPESNLAVLREDEEFRPDSLETQGFVHCSKPGQIVVVADASFANRDDLVLLLLDEARIEDPVRYETNESGAGSAYPHIYGPLRWDYVVGVFDFPRDETGFRLPEELLDV